jgi:hypothetical protein
VVSLDDLDDEFAGWLAEGSFDAAEFTIVTACSFASPRFDAGISPDAGG